MVRSGGGATDAALDLLEDLRSRDNIEEGDAKDLESVSY